jgi:hypothetical protein
MEGFDGRALSECLQEGSMLGAHQVRDSVCRHGNARVGKSWSRELNTVRGRVAVEEEELQRHTEGGTRLCVGVGGNEVKCQNGRRHGYPA